MRRTLMLLVLLATALLILPTSLGAQTTINPRTVEFTASTDHNTLLGGTPILTRYEMRIFLQGATSPFSVQDLGKPTPNAQNVISVTNAAWFVALTMNLTYAAKVAAIGPAGEGVSDSSNPFGNAGSPSKPGTPVIKQ